MLNNFVYPALLALITAALSLISYYIKKVLNINNANAKGTMLLLRREIINDHYKFCVKGEPIQAFDLSDITEVHKAYKELGGNGLTDKMFEDIMELEIGGDK